MSFSKNAIIFLSIIVFLGACSSGPVKKPNLPSKPTIQKENKMTSSKKPEVIPKDKNANYTKIRNSKGGHCYIYLPKSIRADFTDATTSKKTCKNGIRFYPKKTYYRDFWNQRRSYYGDIINVESKGNRLDGSFYNGMLKIGTTLTVRKVDKLGNTIRIERYTTILKSGRKPNSKRLIISSTEMKLESVKTAQEIAAEKREKEAKAAREKAKKKAEAEQKKRIKRMKLASAKAKGCKGLYTGKALDVRKKKLSIMDIFNFKLKDYYEINGVDHNSKSATIRDTKSGKLINMTCAQVQLLSE